MPPKDLKELSILLVDDDPKDLNWLEQSLAPLGVRLHKLEDPQQVLRQVESARPDLVVLDALLPGVSGFDLCKRIKSEPGMGETLVVIITGVYLKAQYRRDALQSFKADGFVTKPCRPVELQRVVLGLLAKKLKTTPFELGGRLRRSEEELPLLEPEEEPGWLLKMWRRFVVTSELGRDRSVEMQEDALPISLEGGEAPKEPQTVLVDSESAAEVEPEETEGTVRLRPTDASVSVLPLALATPAPQDQGSPEPAPSPPRREAPRPQAIHRGIPVYGEEDFLFELRREVSRSQRLGRPLTLVLIRVTDLDQIVELVGAGFRRQLLWHVAEQAMETLRQVDLAGHLTSQELVGLIAFASGRYGGRRIVSRVQRAIKRRPFSVGAGLPAIIPALRFGIAAFPKEGEDIDSLLEHARRELAP